MSPSAFLNRQAPPDRAQLETVLRGATGAWDELRAGIASTFAPLAEKWSYSGKSYGWLLQLRRGDRTVLNLVPCPGYFVASLALNERGHDEALRSGLPDSVLEILRDAPVYVEGRAVRVEVRGRDQLASIMKLASLRMAGAGKRGAKSSPRARGASRSGRAAPKRS